MHEPTRKARIRAAAALLLVLAATTAVILVWRPWDPTPHELREATGDAAQLAGVAEVNVKRREITHTPATKLGPEPSEYVVSARLEADLTPEHAAAVAERVHGLLVPVAAAVAPDEVSVFLRVTAGEPDGSNGDLVDPLEVWYSAASGTDDVADAVTIWQAGARRVRIHGREALAGPAGSEPGSPPGSPAGVGIEATAGGDMAALAELAANLGRPADLHLSDGKVGYAGHGSPPDADAVRLAVAVSTRPGVESAVFDASMAPQLSVHATWPDGSSATEQLTRWLEAHPYAPRKGHPVAFTIFGPGYATLTEGWVSAFTPPEPEPHPLPLPTGVEPWPEDAEAPPCTGVDLDVGYGGSDAATGERYAALLARNVSGRPCAVEGVPDIVVRTAGGTEQADVRFEAYEGGAVPSRLVVPPGEQVLAPMRWRAMSTANDPNPTTSIQVIAVPGAEQVLLDVTEHESSPEGLDILDGAVVYLAPWVQALEGWS